MFSTRKTNYLPHRDSNLAPSKDIVQETSGKDVMLISVIHPAKLSNVSSREQHRAENAETSKGIASQVRYYIARGSDSKRIEELRGKAGRRLSRSEGNMLGTRRKISENSLDC